MKKKDTCYFKFIVSFLAAALWDFQRMLCLALGPGLVHKLSRLGKPSIPTHCTVSVKLTLGGVGVKGIDAKRSSKWVNIIFFTKLSQNTSCQLTHMTPALKTFLKSQPVQFETCARLSVGLGLHSF